MPATVPADPIGPVGPSPSARVGLVRLVRLVSRDRRAARPARPGPVVHRDQVGVGVEDHQARSFAGLAGLNDELAALAAEVGGMPDPDDERLLAIIARYDSTFVGPPL
jgi:hypothetical protein